MLYYIHGAQVSVYSKQDVVQPLDNNRWIVTEWSEVMLSFKLYAQVYIQTT